MKSLFTFLLVLLLMFSCALSCYIAFFKFPLNSRTAKGLTFVAIGTALTAIFFVICFTFIWPPAM